MSNLKYRSLPELIEDHAYCKRSILAKKKLIRKLKQEVSGQLHRLVWINKYIEDKRNAQVEVQLKLPLATG